MSPTVDVGQPQGTPDKAQDRKLPKSLRLWGQGTSRGEVILHPSPHPNGAESLWEPL